MAKYEIDIPVTVFCMDAVVDGTRILTPDARDEVLKRHDELMRSAPRKRGINFPVAGAVPIRDELDDGCSRSVHYCDYIEDGIPFVIKKAKSNRGRVNNMFEYRIYQHAKGTELERLYPIFKDMTPDGKYLLVESCVTADAYFKFMFERFARREDFLHRFPSSLDLDMHGRNWGFTREHARPVILDMGWDSRELSSMAYDLGVPASDIEQLKQHDESNELY